MIDKLQEMINNSEKIVFFDGAGTSTDSGLKDFRGKNGLYKDNPEYILSHKYFYSETEKFYDYYKKNFNCLDTKINIVHRYLKKLEDSGKLKAIITQNIDGLHIKAGCKNVYEIHGTIYENYCIKCDCFYDAKDIFNNKDIPKCICGGLIKPNVVLYGESLSEDLLIKVINAIQKADMLIVAGTSLTVEPACHLVNIFKGKYLVIINNDKTPYDHLANLVINDNLTKIFKNLTI